MKKIARLSVLFTLWIISMISMTTAAAPLIFMFTLSSSAIKNNGPISAKYTCFGQDISPPLKWAEAPAATQAFALIMHDPDASSGDWTHWVLYNIPGEVNSLAEDITAQEQGILVGVNSWNQSLYQGPCPPQGTHHYQFDLYALDQALFVGPNLTADQLQQAMMGHVLGKTTLTGLYTKS